MIVAFKGYFNVLLSRMFLSDGIYDKISKLYRYEFVVVFVCYEMNFLVRSKVVRDITVANNIFYKFIDDDVVEVL